MVTTSDWTTGQITVVWRLTFGVGKFVHCIVTNGEIVCSVDAGSLPIGSYFHWLLFATLGNIVCGVLIVSRLATGKSKNCDPLRHMWARLDFFRTDLPLRVQAMDKAVTLSALPQLASAMCKALVPKSVFTTGSDVSTTPVVLF